MAPTLRCACSARCGVLYEPLPGGAYAFSMRLDQPFQRVSSAPDASVRFERSDSAFEARDRLQRWNQRGDAWGYLLNRNGLLQRSAEGFSRLKVSARILQDAHEAGVGSSVWAEPPVRTCGPNILAGSLARAFPLAALREHAVRAPWISARLSARRNVRTDAHSCARTGTQFGVQVDAGDGVCVVN